MKAYLSDQMLTVCGERLGDKEYAERDKFKALFKPTGKYPKNLCGNVRVVFTPKGKAKLDDYTTRMAIAEGKYINSFAQISSALALYRAVSVFQVSPDANHQDWYKSNWTVLLKHKSGQHLMLGEWKGGFQIFTEAHNLKELPKDFIKDCEAFLAWFVSKRVPIGYDGVVAGEVA